MAELYDNAHSFLGGVNQGLDQSLLKADQLAMGLNLTVRQGLAKSRPVFERLGVTLPAGKFQGAAPYTRNSGDRIVFGVAGKVYTLNLTTLEVLGPFGSLNATVDRFFFCQADRYMIVQDGYNGDEWAEANWPVILNADALIDQSSINNSLRIPKGSVMAYGHGRLFVATDYIYTAGEWVDEGRTGFVAGDIIKAYDPAAVLSFIENTYLSEGGRFTLPEEMGFIRGMTFQKNIVNGVGQGPLIVGADEGISAFLINAPRDQWGDIDIGTVLYTGAGVGVTSSMAFQTLGSDIYYRSVDGIRSLRDSYSRKESSMANEPISTPVQDMAVLDAISARRLASISTANNRVFCTVNKVDDVFKGLISLDLAPYGLMLQTGLPIYDGLWSGYDIYQTFTIRNQAYLAVKNASDLTEFMLLNEDAVTGSENGSGVVSRAYTGAKYFNSMFTMKWLKYVDLWVSGLSGDVTVKVYYRADHYGYWSLLGSGSVHGSTGDYQRRRRLRVSGEEQGPNDPVLDIKLDRGYAFQFCIEWTGRLQLNRVSFVADPEADDFMTFFNEPDSEALTLPSDQVQLDDYNDYGVFS